MRSSIFRGIAPLVADFVFSASGTLDVCDFTSLVSVFNSGQQDNPMTLQPSDPTRDYFSNKNRTSK